MVDNFDKIKNLLHFDDSGDTFYHLQLLKRKKEHPNLGRNSICLLTRCISSIDDLEKSKDDIVGMCEVLNLRAYININARSFKVASLSTSVKLSRQIMQDDFKGARKAYSSAIGALSTKKGFQKSWILDCDDMSIGDVINISKEIESIEPIGDKLIEILETKNGYHLITKPFNVSVFSDMIENGTIPDVDIQKNNPTILYCKTN